MNFYESWGLCMWILWVELSFVNVNFRRAEHWECEFMRATLCECEFYQSQALWMWILWELGFANMNLWKLSFVNANASVNFYERLALWMCILWTELCMWILWELGMWILWELSFVNVNFMRVELCDSEFYESWTLWMWILWGSELCDCEFYER